MTSAPQERVEAQLALEVTGRGPGLIADAAAVLCLAPGAKRARPRLLLLLGGFSGAPAPALIDAAVAIELLHSASLLHDDVVDMGDTRRGRPTVSAQHGNSVAVLVGDHLLSRAMRRLVPHSTALVDATVAVLEEMSRAAILEVQARGDVELTVGAWRDIAAGKTASLFGLCGTAAGLLGTDHAMAAPLRDIGRHLGMAFQMQDDLADLLEAESSHSDLRQKNPSFPLVVAARADSRFAAQLDAAWMGTTVEPAAAAELADAVMSGPAIAATLEAIALELDAMRGLLVSLGAAAIADQILAATGGLGRDPRGAKR